MIIKIGMIAFIPERFCVLLAGSDTGSELVWIYRQDYVVATALNELAMK